MRYFDQTNIGTFKARQVWIIFSFLYSINEIQRILNYFLFFLHVKIYCRDRVFLEINQKSFNDVQMTWLEYVFCKISGFFNTQTTLDIINFPIKVEISTKISTKPNKFCRDIWKIFRRGFMLNLEICDSFLMGGRAFTINSSFIRDFPSFLN